MKIVGIPLRSPDVSLCDFAIFPELDRRILAAAKKRGGGRMTNDAYEQFIKKVATSRSMKDHVKKSIDHYPKIMQQIAKEPRLFCS